MLAIDRWFLREAMALEGRPQLPKVQTDQARNGVHFRQPQEVPTNHEIENIRNDDEHHSDPGVRTMTYFLWTNTIVLPIKKRVMSGKPGAWNETTPAVDHYRRIYRNGCENGARPDLPNAGQRVMETKRKYPAHGEQKLNEG